MIQEFFNREKNPEAEAEYESWLDSHPADGFVFNHFGGNNSGYNLIHRASCWVLRRPVDAGARTHVRKLCSTDRSLLVQQAMDELGSDSLWRFCKICKPDSDLPCVNKTQQHAPPMIQPKQESDRLIEAGHGHEQSDREGTVFIPGSPAVWLASDEAEWKSRISENVGAWDGLKPEWLDMSFHLASERFSRRDLDNLITPVLDALRDGGVVEPGFNTIGTISARKVRAKSDADERLIIRQASKPPPLNDERAGVFIEALLTGKDEDTVKRILYRKAAELYWIHPDLACPAIVPIALDIRVEIADPGPRKSIKALLKPCIDGLEPILSRPDGLPPLSLAQLDNGDWRNLAPQDEMVVDLRFDVRGGDQDKITAVISMAEGIY